MTWSTSVFTALQNADAVTRSSNENSVWLSVRLYVCPPVRPSIRLSNAWIVKTRSSAIAERPCCSLFKLWQKKYKREKRASGLFF